VIPEPDRLRQQWLAAVVLLLAGALSLTSCSRDAPSSATAIHGVTVIDAINGIRDHQIVVFDGDRITAVADVGEETPPAGTVIDGRGRFLIPGLWDMHVHLTYDDDFTPSMPAMFLYYGVTSVRDTGGLLHKLEPAIEAMREPGAHAPRVWFSGPLLDGKLVVYNGDSRPEIGITNPDPRTARETVDVLVDDGVDFIKIYELVEPPVFDALTTAARDRDLPIAAHVPLSMTAPRVGPRVDSMEHLRNIELACAEDAAELHEARRSAMAEYQPGSGFELRASLHSMQRVPAIARYDAARCDTVLQTLRHTIQVPTLRLNGLPLVAPFTRDDWLPALELLPQAPRDAWRAETDERLESPDDDVDTAFAEWSLKLVGDMNARRVPIAAGTDTPIGYAIPGYSLHSELEMLVRAGLSPLEALGTATVQSPRFFALDDEMGIIEPGMRADLVMLTANPLDNIANTRMIELVVHRGRVQRRDELAEHLARAINPPQGASP